MAKLSLAPLCGRDLLARTLDVVARRGRVMTDSRKYGGAMTATHLAPFPTPMVLPARPVFTRVVFGIDFGSASLAAARWAAQHVVPRADVIASHVASADAVAISEEGLDHQTAAKRLMPALAGGLGGFAATLDSRIVRTIVRIGRPSHWLPAIASGVEAGLVVLGRRADANRKSIGEPNVIERVARRVPCSVLVVPEGVTAAPQSIVAAVDDSSFAARVVFVARRLAQAHELPLTLLHVLSPSTGTSSRGGRRALSGQRAVWVSPGEMPSVGSIEKSRWLDALSKSPDSISRERCEIAVGDAAREIISSGLASGSPLIIAGMRGADDAVSGSIGSVVRELLTRAPAPVLAVNVM
jgi:nucleotide-binding universal stress UspA family protein